LNGFININCIGKNLRSDRRLNSDMKTRTS